MLSCRMPCTALRAGPGERPNSVVVPEAASGRSRGPALCACTAMSVSCALVTSAIGYAFIIIKPKYHKIETVSKYCVVYILMWCVVYISGKSCNIVVLFLFGNFELW